MNEDNIIKYIKSGLGFPAEKKFFRIQSAMPLLATLLMGLVPGIVLGKHWQITSCVMIIVAILFLIIVMILSEYSLTIAKRLILQTVICLGWIIEISLLEVMYFTLLYGFNVCLLVLYIPIILIPLLLGIKNKKDIEKDIAYEPKKIIYSRFRMSFFFAGILGMNFARVFRNSEQNVAIVIILICFTLLNSIFSVGLLSVQRLYYLIKLKQIGISLE